MAKINKIHVGEDIVYEKYILITVVNTNLYNCYVNPCKFLTKLEIALPQYLAIQLLGLYSKGSISYYRYLLIQVH